MSAPNVVSKEVMDTGLRREMLHRHQSQSTSFIALGFIFLLLTIVIMTSVMIYLCLTGSGGESLLFLGVVPFTLVFVLILMSR